MIEEVGAESGDAGNFVAEIDVAGLLKDLHLKFRSDFVEHLLQFVALEDGVIDAFQFAANTNNGLRIRCKMEVRRTDLDHEVEKFIELRHLLCSSPESLGLALTFLTIDANSRPRYGVESCTRYFFLAIHANAVDPLVEPENRFLDGSEQLGIGLLQRKPDMNIALHAGVINPVPAFGARFNRRHPARSRAEDIIALGRENFSIF